MALEQLAGYNVIAAFPGEEAARRAVALLHDHEVPATQISYLGQAATQRQQDTDALEDTDATVAPQVGKGIATGGVTGGAAGGAAGFLAGLVTVGIPGAGPLVGAGVLAATVGGAVAGATAGGVGGGILKLWDAHYRDAVASGGALVGVHSDDQRIVAEAARLLEKERPSRIDHLDPEGNILDE